MGVKEVTDVKVVVRRLSNHKRLHYTEKWLVQGVKEHLGIIVSLIVGIKSIPDNSVRSGKESTRSFKKVRDR